MQAGADAGLAALKGQGGPARNAFIYAAAPHHLGRENSLASAADKAQQVLNSGKALPLFKQQQN